MEENEYHQDEGDSWWRDCWRLGKIKYAIWYIRNLTDGLVKEERFADIFDFRDCAFEVEGF